MSNTITINLAKSKHAKEYSFKTQSLIHSDQFERVMGIIHDYIPKSEEEENKRYLHNTITLLGSRGSGKTSFLLSIKKLAQERLNEKHPEFANDLEILDIIDPTLIEQKGHVFLNVIACIKNRIEKELEKRECNSNREGKSDREDWKHALVRLAAGLPSIDGIGSPNQESWQDPEFVMENGLKAVDSALKLEQNFNELLHISLKILNKKAFLLMFDDIDVDATKGWAVLETIRKYFTGGRLITIVSGDIQLYSTVVRQQKWKNFGEDILKYEGEQLNRLEVFNTMITELESQYLQKILRPENRIHLPTIRERKSNEKDLVINVFNEDHLNENALEINDAYSNILKYFGIRNKYQQNTYSNFLLGLPLRTQIQFLSLFDLNTGKLSSGVSSIVDIFISDMYAWDIEPNIAIKTPSSINGLILDFLLEKRRLEEFYQLQPTTTDDSLNGILTTLNFLLSEGLKRDPYLIFDYFIKIGYTRNLVPLLGYEDLENPGPSIDQLCDNSSIMNDAVLRDITGNIIAYIRGYIAKDDLSGSEKTSKSGTIPLFGEASKAKKYDKSSAYRIDQVLRDNKANKIQSSLVYMPLSSNQYVYKQSSLLTYSAFTLLSVIGELVKRVTLNDEKNGFTELSQLRSYVMPDFKQGTTEVSEDFEDEPIDSPEENEKTDFPILQQFKEWVEQYEKNKITISTHLLGKIITRFYYALTNLEGKVRSKNLGEVFHSHILAFMNAVLIEDCRENTTISDVLNLNNTNYNDKIFLDNIKNIHKSNYPSWKEDLAFSRWMLSCPFLRIYLKHSSTLENALLSYCEGYIANEKLEVDLFKFLDKIAIKGDLVEKYSLKNPDHYQAIYNLIQDNKLTINNEQDILRALKDLGVTNVGSSYWAKFMKDNRFSF